MINMIVIFMVVILATTLVLIIFNFIHKEKLYDMHLLFEGMIKHLKDENDYLKRYLTSQHLKIDEYDKKNEELIGRVNDLEDRMHLYKLVDDI